MRRIVILLLIIFSFFAGYISKSLLKKNPNYVNNSGSENVFKQKPLTKYSIENLVKANIEPGTIEPSTKLAETDEYVSYLINFRFKPDFENEKNVSGQINIPAGDGPFPIVIMLRGYVNQKLYKTGDGTRNAAKYFAENGFITISPDFLGYGKSDSEAENIFETRFQTYTTTLALFETIKKDFSFAWDRKNILIWGHSNGGQIALTLLEITGGVYPTSLWAPVSKPFPYSILYYTDESDDHGKLIRNELSKFEETYDVELYSLTNYFDKIKAPLQIHQGTNDDAVPIEWTDQLTSTLKTKGKNVEYFKHFGADHNLRPYWDKVVAKDLEFFKKYLK